MKPNDRHIARRGRQPGRMAGLILCLGIVATLHAAQQDPVAVGMTENRVREILGKPAGSMTMHDHTTLLYPECKVELQDGRVIAVVPRNRPHSPQPPTKAPAGAPSAAGQAPAAGTSREKDLPALMQRIREGSTIDRANAILACNGAWAAAAVPLIVEYLDNETMLDIYTVYSGGGRVLTGHRSIGRAAAESLGNIGIQAWDHCMRVLSTGNAAARSNAAWALMMIFTRHKPDDTRFPALLLQTYHAGVMNSPDTLRHKTVLAQIIAKIPGPDFTNALHHSLRHTDQTFKAAVIGLLGQRQDPASIPLLAEIFLDGSAPRLSEPAGEALAEYRTAAAARAVQSGANHADGRIRRQTMAILGQSGEGDYMPSILAALQDPDPFSRAEALRGLSKHANPGHTTALVNLLLDEKEDQVASLAYSILANLVGSDGDEHTVRLMLPGMADRNPRKRVLFANLLGGTGRAAAYPVLAQAALQDQDELVRRTVLMHLNKFDDPGRAEVYISVLRSDPSPACRDAARLMVTHGFLKPRAEPILLDIVQSGRPEFALESALTMAEMHVVNKRPAVIDTLIKGLAHTNIHMAAKSENALLNEAGLSKHGPEGKALGRDPAKWRAWWSRHGDR